MNSATGHIWNRNMHYPSKHILNRNIWNGTYMEPKYALPPSEGSMKCDIGIGCIWNFLYAEDVCDG